jgi:hypothetical protein
MQDLNDTVNELIRQLEEQGLPIPDDIVEQVAKGLEEQE